MSDRCHIFVKNGSFFDIEGGPECVFLLIFSQLADVVDDLHVSVPLHEKSKKVG